MQASNSMQELSCV